MTDVLGGAELTGATADVIAAIGADRLSDGDLDQLDRLIFDASACALGAVGLPWVAATRRWAEESGGRGPAAAVGSAYRFPSTVAALVNGTAVHSFELDDTHDASLSHPASVTVTTALAVAMEVDAPGEQVYAAIAAGYETMARLGRAMNTAELIAHGFHPTAVYGTFGAASVAATLYGLGVDGLLGSWGHALSLTGGSMQFAEESTGTAVKRSHAGFAARSGVLAAQLIRAGVDAPRRALDGRYGALRLYGRDTRPERLAEVRPALAISEISMKPYACCRQFHAAIDALRSATNEFAVPSADIDRIVVAGPAVLREQHLLRRPASTMAAQYSLPYTMAATAVYGASDLTAYDEVNLGRPDVLELADRVDVEVDQDLEGRYPETLGGDVLVRLRDGSTRHRRVLDSRGTPAWPLGWPDLAEKATALRQRAGNGFDPDHLAGCVRQLRNAAGSTVVVADLLRGRP